MIELKLELPKELEKCLDYLETASKKSKEFIIREALIQYVEDMEDIQEISVLEAIEGKNKQKTYTSEELTKILGL
jgi:RHH-type transcriptional regulator, rel operon repressor / antitoxin RelB